MQIQCTRYELYAPDPITSIPTGYVVGFEATFDNGAVYYQDTVVSLDDAAGKTQKEVATLALSRIQPDIDEQNAKVIQSVIGMSFTPGA